LTTSPLDILVFTSFSSFGKLPVFDGTGRMTSFDKLRMTKKIRMTKKLRKTVEKVPTPSRANGKDKPDI